MNYTLHQLKIFVKVAELKSVTKASEELFMSQPGVSIQLKKLQDQFEIPLTEVIGKKLYVTDFGIKVLAVSKKILEESDLLKFTVSQFKGLLTGKISFSIVSTAKYILPFYLKEFVSNYPEIEMSIDVTNKSKVLDSLKNNTTDFALISVLPEDLNLIKIELLTNHLFMVGPGHENDTSKFKIQESPLIFRENGSATRTAMEDYLDYRKINFNKKLELVSNEAIKQSVIAGLGYSIMPIIGLKNELLNGSIKIIHQPKLPIISKWYLVYNSGKKLTPASMQFIEYINNNKANIMMECFGWERQFVKE